MADIFTLIGAGLVALAPIAIVAALLLHVRLHLRYRRFFRKHAHRPGDPRFAHKERGRGWDGQ